MKKIENKEKDLLLSKLVPGLGERTHISGHTLQLLLQTWHETRNQWLSLQNIHKTILLTLYLGVISVRLGFSPVSVELGQHVLSNNFLNLFSKK